MLLPHSKRILFLLCTMPLFPFKRNCFHYSLPRMINFSGQDWTWVAELWNYVIGSLVSTLGEAQRLKPERSQENFENRSLLYSQEFHPGIDCCLLLQDPWWSGLLRCFSTFVTSHSCLSSALHTHWCSIKLTTHNDSLSLDAQTERPAKCFSL